MVRAEEGSPRPLRQLRDTGRRGARPRRARAQPKEQPRAGEVARRTSTTNARHPVRRVGCGMRKILLRIVVVLVVVAGAIYLWNASWRVAMPPGETQLIAHRGVHQLFSLEGVENDTCTAERIFPPTHDFLENTLPSMEAAFAA